MWLSERLITVVTVTGDTLRLDPGKVSRWDFGEIYLTLDCPDCPLFIPATLAIPFLELVAQSNNRAHISVLDNYRGLCTFSVADGGFSPLKKFLISRPEGLRHCSRSAEQRIERVDLYRKNGLLTTPQI